MFFFIILLLFIGVVFGFKIGEYIYLQKFNLINWEVKEQREGFCKRVINQSQSYFDLRKVVVESLFFMLLDFFIINMGFYSIIDIKLNVLLFRFFFDCKSFFLMRYYE